MVRLAISRRAAVVLADLVVSEEVASEAAALVAVGKGIRHESFSYLILSFISDFIHHFQGK